MKPSQLQSTEFAPFYATYISQVSEEYTLVEELEISLHRLIKFVQDIPMDKFDYQYAEGKWTIKDILQHLIDGDMASNNGGWQWAAGTGTDAQPYFRIFNPVAQAEKFDPEGKYIQRYVSEVDTLAYPAPIVDHAQQRVKALALFKRI